MQRAEAGRLLLQKSNEAFFVGDAVFGGHQRDHQLACAAYPHDHMAQKPLACQLIVGLHAVLLHPAAHGAQHLAQSRHGYGTMVDGHNGVAAAAVEAQLGIIRRTAHRNGGFVAALPGIVRADHVRHVRFGDVQTADAREAVHHLHALGAKGGGVRHVLAAAAAALVIHRAARLGTVGAG